jgi:hypothetical protein
VQFSQESAVNSYAALNRYKIYTRNLIKHNSIFDYLKTKRGDLPANPKG